MKPKGTDEGARRVPPCSPSAAEEQKQERSSSPAWNWMDDVLDASFPASDPPSFSPTRIGKPPRR
jgi:hypothetical protein